MTSDSARFTLRLTGELKRRLEKTGRDMGISLNALVVQILWDWAKNNLNEEETK